MSELVYITGAAGMVGSSLEPHLRALGYEVKASDIRTRRSHERLDVTDSDAVSRTLNAIRPSIVVHLAAETDVDLCEAQEKRAYLVNVLGTQNVARWCARNDAT